MCFEKKYNLVNWKVNIIVEVVCINCHYEITYDSIVYIIIEKKLKKIN
jgi:hypothetical protein